MSFSFHPPIPGSLPDSTPRRNGENAQTNCDDILFADDPDSEEDRQLPSTSLPNLPLDVEQTPNEHSENAFSSENTSQQSSPLAKRVHADEDHHVRNGSGKCRYEEVDYSRTLRTDLYEKDVVVKRLRLRLREQGAELTKLQQQYQTQYELAIQSAQQQIRTTQEMDAQKQRSELDRIRQQLELDMQSQLQTNLATIHTQSEQQMRDTIADVENRLQEEIKNANLRMMAEKEKELASIELRYARFGQKDRGTSLPPDAGGTAEQFSPRTRDNPPVRPTTSSLDAIRRLKKARGVSRRTRLVGVMIDDDELPPGRTKSAPEDRSSSDDDEEQPRPTPSSVSPIVDAVTKSVEALLRKVMADGGKFPSPYAKRSPRRRKVEDEELQHEKSQEPSYHRSFILNEVRFLFKEKFGISQDTDFIVHVPASRTDVYAYEHEDGPGPDTDILTFDLTQNQCSIWNSRVLDILLQELQARCEEQNWPVKKSDIYILDILRARYKRLRTVWRNAQPKVTSTGTLESGVEVEERLLDQRLQIGKESRRATRRRNKFYRRTTVLNHIVELKTADDEDDLLTWKWLRRLVLTLGEHGMSSEESDVENQVESVLRVKNMEWRRCISAELDIVDFQRALDTDIFAPQGSKPVKRIRASGNPLSDRKPVRGLPLALYDDSWLKGLTQRQVEYIDISNDDFSWMKIAVVQT